tara:strand:+ start:3693 stop:4556 length:864 start_codon:yes stop_codon:yes gene_type:complete
MTYSIVARCLKTGNLGVAVQSHWFAAGVVCWAKSGVGAVATQAMALIDHGPNGINEMEKGRRADEALENCLSLDDTPEIRQVAMIDSSGISAVHTGSQTIPESGHIVGDSFACQANMMWNPTVWQSMHDQFINSHGDLADKMLSALNAAEAEGGDIRGMQSARILVVSAEPNAKPWMDTIIDIRVDDHSEPLSEISRLLSLHRAYSSLNDDSEDGSVNSFDIPEIAFWRSIELANMGLHDEARALSSLPILEHNGWKELLIRCAKSGVAGITNETVGILLDCHPDDF